MLKKLRTQTCDVSSVQNNSMHACDVSSMLYGAIINELELTNHSIKK